MKKTIIKIKNWWLKINFFLLLMVIQFSSVVYSCLTLCDPMNCSMPGFPVHHQLLEFTQTHIHWVSDAIQPSHSLSSPSPPALNLPQHQDLFQWVNSLHQVAKVLDALEPSFSLLKVLWPPFENAYSRAMVCYQEHFYPQGKLQRLKTCLTVVTAG